MTFILASWGTRDQVPFHNNASNSAAIAARQARSFEAWEKLVGFKDSIVALKHIGRGCHITTIACDSTGSVAIYKYVRDYVCWWGKEDVGEGDCSYELVILVSSIVDDISGDASCGGGVWDDIWGIGNGPKIPRSVEGANVDCWLLSTFMANRKVDSSKQTCRDI